MSQPPRHISTARLRLVTPDTTSPTEETSSTSGIKPAKRPPSRIARLLCMFVVAFCLFCTLFTLLAPQFPGSIPRDQLTTAQVDELKTDFLRDLGQATMGDRAQAGFEYRLSTLGYPLPVTPRIFVARAVWAVGSMIIGILLGFWNVVAAVFGPFAWIALAVILAAVLYYRGYLPSLNDLRDHRALRRLFRR